MLEPKNDAPGASGNGLGFKGFNQVGREDTAREVLRPQVDPATRLRAALLIAVVAVLMCIVFYVAFSRSHLSLIPTPDDDNRQFGPGPRSVDSGG